MSHREDAPYFYELIVSVSPLLPPEVKDRLFLSSDRCIIENWFFIRGCLKIPVLDADENFNLDIWVTINRDNYDRTLKLGENPERVYERPYLGWLATRIPGYKDTLNLKARVHTRAVGERPLIELEPSKHKLAKEQREGIKTERVREIAEMMLGVDKESF
jgi:hypothetical protein